MITLNRIAIVILICINAPAFCMENNTPTPKSFEKKRKKIVRFQSEPDIIRSPHHQRRTSAPEHVLLTAQEIQTLKETIQQEKKNAEHLKELSKSLKLKKSKGGLKQRSSMTVLKPYIATIKKGLLVAFMQKLI
ncbi:hypothetical protein Noda2021_10100 [Candidatus Dependentiae bacterium Noda2021]|nr:hypothetical protein Noda2021_10100 [Candidatus Dependentiae bacterium Noda2021]